MLFKKVMEKMLEVKWCQKTMKKHFNRPMILTEQDDIGFQKSIKCHTCDKKYTEKELETIVILLESTEDQVIKNAI